MSNGTHPDNAQISSGQNLANPSVDDYLSLADAIAILSSAPTDWNKGHQAISNREGWGVFNIAGGTDWFGDVGIERFDEPELLEECDLQEPLEDDDAAVEICNSNPDSPTHQLALKIHHAANSWRFYKWGGEWVDSRLGPS